MADAVKISSLVDFPGQLQDGGYIPLDDGANAYRFTPFRLADYATGTAPVYSLGAPGAVPRTITAKLREFVDVRDFGVKANGTTDDTDALQKAFDAGVDLRWPAGNVILSGPIYGRTPNCSFDGKGGNSDNGTKITFTHDGDGFVFSSTLAGRAMRRPSFSRMLISHVGYSSGRAIVLDQCQNPRFEHISILGFNRGIDAVGSRGGYMNCATISAKKPGGYCLRLHGNVGDAGGLWNIDNVKWDCADTTASNGSGMEADGLVISGAVGTVTGKSIQVVRARDALAILDVGNTVANSNPGFIFLDDFQSDNTGRHGVRAEIGADIRIRNGWVQGRAEAAGVYVGPKVDGFLWEGRVGGGNNHGMELAGKRIRIVTPTIARNSQSAIGTYDGIVIRSTAESVEVMGGAVGSNENGTGGQRYGVVIENGARRVRVIGVDLSGNLTGPLVNQAAAEQVIVQGCYGIDDNITAITAPVSTLVDIGNANGVAAKVGNTTGPVVNWVRLTGGLAGQFPAVRVDGADAHIDFAVVTKGDGLLRYGAAIPAAGATATHVVRFKLESGTVFELLARQVT
jgi:hypothetical protein